MPTLNNRKPEPLESAIQNRLIRILEQKGWYVQKTEGRSRNGFPDVTAVDTLGNVWFIELKRTVGRPSPDQCRELKALAKHNANVILLYGMKAVDTLLFYRNWVDLTNMYHYILVVDSEGKMRWTKEI
jgi:VRR-NUC domain.|nr:MAG TPA: Nuclease [Caudoviricetes sp.]